MPELQTTNEEKIINLLQGITDKLTILLFVAGLFIGHFIVRSYHV
jgi:hypothetical protein